MKRMILILSFLTSCFARSAVMTRENFENIEQGDPISQVVCLAGKPYCIKECNGKQVYLYIERINMDTQTVIENYYYITVVNDKVVSKRLSQEELPDYSEIYNDDPTDYDYQ